MQIDWNLDQAKLFIQGQVDFCNFKSKYHRPLVGKRELLYKAFGSGVSSILDLTAGLAEDAWTLARLGYQVIALEQNPFLYDCLSQAHKKALAHEFTSVIAQRVSFVHAEAFEYLSLMPSRPEACYLDPMFDFLVQPSALPRKEMQCMRLLLEPDSPQATQKLLDTARTQSQKRVVMKGPRRNAKNFGDPSFQVLGRALKYDVFLSVGGKG